MSTSSVTRSEPVRQILTAQRRKVVSPAPVAVPAPAPGGPSLGVQLLTAGTAACFGDLITFPLDTIKVRLQVQGESALVSNGAGRGIFGTFLNIVKTEGPSCLYSGLVPGLQRQMAFSAIRIGAYEPVKLKYQQLTGVEKDQGMKMMGVRVAAGLSTGTLAILVAQPTDVVKVRMQAAGSASAYRSVFSAYSSIYRLEGFFSGLYRGTAPNIARNCIINVGETVVYDAVKDTLLARGLVKEGVQCHLASAVVAGVSATVLASPVDVIKTRYMNSPSGVYKGALHCARQTLATEGPRAFYKGFQVSCMRLVSWNICLWLSYEQLKLMTKSYFPKTEDY